MGGQGTPETVIEGRVGRKTSNALTMTFNSGPDQPVATALQGGADGFGRKMGVLFGFKNGGVGIHELTLADGRVFRVESGDRKPTIVTTASDAPFATITRSKPSAIATLADGSEVVHIADDPEGAKTFEAFRLQVLTPGGERIGRLQIIRTLAGWSLGRDIADSLIWWGHAGQPMKVPFLGSLLLLDRQPTDVELTIMLSACVDMAIGLRPYGTQME